MGSCPHCEFTGRAEVEELESHSDEHKEFYRGQLVCPNCNTILGGVQSYGTKADVDNSFL